MFCTTCEVPIADCVCPDRDASLKSVVMDPDSAVAFKWCRLCDKHYARCKCAEPDFYILSRGKEVNQSEFRDVLGRRVIVDLKNR